MHENRTVAVFIHLLNVFALSLQIQYKSSHWVYNCDYHRPALICPDMSPRADKVLCKKHFRNMNKKSIKLNSCQTLHWLNYFTLRDGYLVLIFILISLSCYMDLSIVLLIYGFLWVVTWIHVSKLIHEFPLVLIWICQSCHMDLLNLLLWFVLCCFMHFSPRLEICQKFYMTIFLCPKFYTLKMRKSGLILPTIKQRKF